MHVGALKQRTVIQLTLLMKQRKKHRENLERASHIHVRGGPLLERGQGNRNTAFKLCTYEMTHVGFL